MRAAAEAATVIGVIVALCTQARIRTRIQEWAVVRYVYRWTRFQNAASGIHPDNSRRNRLTRSVLGWLVPRSYRPGSEIPDDKRISLDNEIEYRMPWFNLHALKNNQRLYDRIKDYSDVKETPRWVKELRECHRGVVCADCGTGLRRTQQNGRDRAKPRALIVEGSYPTSASREQSPTLGQAPDPAMVRRARRQAVRLEMPRRVCLHG